MIEQDPVPGYCLHLHAGLQIFFDRQGNLTVSPCCSWNQPYYPVTNADVFNHPNLKADRAANQQTQQLLPGKCQLCEDRVSDHRGNRDGWHRIYGITEPRYDFTGPVHVSIKADIACNLACVTCNPTLSSRWRNELKVRNGAVRARHDLLVSALTKMDKSRIQTLHVYGGETFLGKTTELILDSMRDYLPQITVWIDTNCTQWPSDQLLELMSQCKSVALKFSVDAIDRPFQYIRYPASWALVEHNMKKFNQELPDNFVLSLRPTVSMLNAHLLNDINLWYVKNLMKRPSGQLNKLEYYPAYGDFALDNTSQEFLNDLRSIYSADHRIHKILDFLPLRNTGLNAALGILDAMDQRRGTNWQESLPHLAIYAR